MVLSLVLCACSKQPEIHIPKAALCLEYGQRTIWGQQSFYNPDLGGNLKASLATGLADHGLRLCDDGEQSSYRLTVTEVRASYKDAGLRPSLIPSGNAVWDVLSGAVVYLTTTGTKKSIGRLSGSITRSDTPPRCRTMGKPVGLYGMTDHTTRN